MLSIFSPVKLALTLILRAKFGYIRHQPGTRRPRRRPFFLRMLANPRKQGVPEHPTRKRPIYKGYRGACLEIPYLRGFPGISLCVFDHYEAPKNPGGVDIQTPRLGAGQTPPGRRQGFSGCRLSLVDFFAETRQIASHRFRITFGNNFHYEIGRASCRERV